MQTINLDISCCPDGPQPVLQVKQGDVGRKFKAFITDNGMHYGIPADTQVTLWYSGTSGQGNYTHVGDHSAASISGSTVTVELITQMLTTPGGGTLCLVLNKKTGEQVGLWNIQYWVESVPGADSPAAQTYYTAFSKSASDVLTAAEKLTLPVPVANGGTGATTWEEALKNLGAAPAIESEEFPGSYYRMEEGEKAWINPPLSPGRGEFRTTQRYGRLPLYAQTIDFGTLPNKTTAYLKVNIPAGRIIRMEGWAAKKDASLKYPLPMTSGEKVHVYMLINSSGSLVIRTLADYSDWNGRVTLWYFK